MLKMEMVAKASEELVQGHSIVPNRMIDVIPPKGYLRKTLAVAPI
jgi:hypothetical protein